MPHGATICTIVVRPRTERKLPALLTYTIYADPENNRARVSLGIGTLA